MCQPPRENCPSPTEVWVLGACPTPPPVPSVHTVRYLWCTIIDSASSSLWCLTLSILKDDVRDLLVVSSLKNIYRHEIRLEIRQLGLYFLYGLLELWAFWYVRNGPHHMPSFESIWKVLSHAVFDYEMCDIMMWLELLCPRYDTVCVIFMSRGCRLGEMVLRSDILVSTKSCIISHIAFQEKFKMINTKI